jgi:ABC-type branched-subunit amino acid transport system substrate-binding protein/serine/threonine protein kinase
MTRVYCTCPQQEHSPTVYEIADEELLAHPRKAQTCPCQIPLILSDRYVPIASLGAGGFGRTFLVIDLNLPSSTIAEKPKRVLKQLYPSQPLSAKALATVERLFQQEAKVLNHLKHSQIPQFYDYFEVTPALPINNGQATQKLFYLVEEYIEGENLEEWVKQQGALTEREVLKILEKLLEVLQFIHSQTPQIIHRDIKPTNIIRSRKNESYHLIDFGAVREVIQVVEEVGTTASGVPQSETRIATIGYAPPEQLHDGKVCPASDLYALAATCLYLLTQQHPQTLHLLSERSYWITQAASPISTALSEVLNRMLDPAVDRRYPSAAAVLAALRRAKLIADGTAKSAGWRPIAAIATLALLGAGGYGWLARCQSLSCKTGDDLSWGEEFLLPTEAVIEKAQARQRAIAAFKQGNYAETVNQLSDYFREGEAAQQVKATRILTLQEQDSLKYLNDPEARIYLNNARAAQTENPFKISVVVPIANESTKDIKNDNATEILRGVAQVQDEINRQTGTRIQNRMLLVQIASDRDDTDSASQIAKDLVNQSGILGVIGHYSSKATIAASEVYSNPSLGDRRLVAISPTSTVVRKPNEDPSCAIPPQGTRQQNPKDPQCFSETIFRVASSDRVAAGDLVAYVLGQADRRRLFVILDEEDIFSNSISREFKRQLQEAAQSRNISANISANIVGTCNLGLNTVEACINAAKQEKADTVLLALTSRLSKEKSAYVTLFADQNIIFLGADTIYGNDILSNAGSKAERRMTLAVPWHRSLAFDQQNSPAPGFEQGSFAFWGSQVNWRTKMSFDATRALAEGLRRASAPTRLGLYEALADPNFTAAGADVVVEFDPSHDRRPFTGLGVLVQVQSLNGKPNFVRLETPARRSGD